MPRSHGPRARPGDEGPAVEAFDDVEDVFVREGFEEEEVGGVVIR